MTPRKGSKTIRRFVDYIPFVMNIIRDSIELFKPSINGLETKQKFNVRAASNDFLIFLFLSKKESPKLLRIGELLRSPKFVKAPWSFTKLKGI